LVYEDGAVGPLHELHAGEGYWSQAGGAIVLGKKKDVSAVEVRWPTGRATRTVVPAGTNEMEIRSPQ
jgi:hypothetical protein